MEKETKRIGLDIGSKRIGVAIGDTETKIATPVTTLERKDEQALIDLMFSRGCTHLVVGLPLNEDGTENPQCKRVRGYCDRLQKRAIVHIYYQDEFLSSVEASEKLGARKGKASEGRVDALAATRILQDYFDSLDVTFGHNEV